MVCIATLGPKGSDGFQAARQYAPEATVRLYNRIPEIVEAFKAGAADYAIIPVYNTREGEVKEYFRLVSQLQEGHWIDNVVLPIHLSLARLAGGTENGGAAMTRIVGRSSVFRQCDEYIDSHFPEATLMAVHDIEAAFTQIAQQQRHDWAIIESEELVRQHGFTLIEREVVSHNRTRFAVLGKKPAPSTGYDATALITRPLRDRVGMLADILGEFTRRGINILDLQSENDIKTQKLRIYIEVEGHISSKSLHDAVERLDRTVIQENDSLKVLGSFPRVDMRVKKIKSFGFIGSGAMSCWFADRLENEGYETWITGRTTVLRPEQMIANVDVVVICVPISVTAATVARYGSLLRGGQALIILAGESENTLQTALTTTDPAVEVMFVHNLWGPQAISMKDKNAVIVRTARSGSFCSEFEAFMYKHGAEIFHDSPEKHDLLMGVGQKLPTTISVALAQTLFQHNIDCEDIGSHSTLTSIYAILAMARVHNQNPRTYAEIMATKGDGRKIVQSFAKNLLAIIDMAEQEKIDEIAEMMKDNRRFMTPQFLQTRMQQARAVDDVLSDGGLRIDL
ncbi:MAG: prephenate dehydratase domain-containing protein [Desulfopila sp.]